VGGEQSERKRSRKLMNAALTLVIIRAAHQESSKRSSQIVEKNALKKNIEDGGKGSRV